MPKCPICGKEVEYLTEHSLYFCSSCNKYFNEKTPQIKSEKKPNDTLMCPYCHSINTGYISDENINFCRQCGKRFNVEKKDKIPKNETPKEHEKKDRNVGAKVSGFFMGLLLGLIGIIVAVATGDKDTLRWSAFGILIWITIVIVCCVVYWTELSMIIARL